MGRTKDLQPGDFPRISKESEPCAEYLNKLYDYVTKQAEDAIIWYYEKRINKRRIGVSLRYIAIFSTAAAGIIPILSILLKNGSETPTITTPLDPGWSAIAIAIAALALAIDKFGNFTNGWIRFVLAAQKINMELDLFRPEWNRELLTLNDPLDKDDVLIMILLGEGLLLHVSQTVQEETNKWVVEFQAALSEVDAAVKAATQAAKEQVKLKNLGALSIEVTNGEKCKEWVVSFDGVAQTPNTGKRMSMINLKPGQIKIDVEGEMDSHLMRDSFPAQIVGGKTTEVKLTLA